MKIELTLKPSDFLTFQLYSSSKSKLQQKNRNKSKYSVSIIYALLGLFLFLSGKQILALIFLIIAVLWYLIFPQYIKWRYKKYFEKHINENFKERVNRTSILDFDNTKQMLIIIEPGLEEKINFSEFKSLIEISTHFFIKLKNGSTLIIPKQFISKPAVFKKIFSDLGVVYENEVNWKWDTTIKLGQAVFLRRSVG